MKQLYIALFLSFASANTFSCEVFPLFQVVNNYKSFFAEADVAFLGTLESYKNNGEYEQVATFIVEKVLKSSTALSDKISIKNSLLSTCSYPVEPVGETFYVFAKVSDSGSYYLDDYASFVPLKYAQENGMEIK